MQVYIIKLKNGDLVKKVCYAQKAGGTALRTGFCETLVVGQILTVFEISLGESV